MSGLVVESVSGEFPVFIFHEPYDPRNYTKQHEEHSKIRGKAENEMENEEAVSELPWSSYPFFRSNSFMNETSASTPSLGKAL